MTANINKYNNTTGKEETAMKAKKNKRTGSKRKERNVGK